MALNFHLASMVHMGELKRREIMGRRAIIPTLECIGVPVGTWITLSPGCTMNRVP